MQNLYIVNRKLVFSKTETLPPSLILNVEAKGSLSKVQAFTRQGVPVTETFVYFKTVNLWSDYGYISPLSNTSTIVQSFFRFVPPILVDPVEEFKGDDISKYHGCYAAVVLFPYSLYVSPVYEDKKILLNKVFSEIQTQEDYWIIQGPEPLLKRLDSSVTADDLLFKKSNVEKMLAQLEYSGVSVVYKNPKATDSTNFGKKFVSKF